MRTYRPQGKCGVLAMSQEDALVNMGGVDIVGSVAHDEDRVELKAYVEANAPVAVRDKIKTWVDWIDFEEGRIK